MTVNSDLLIVGQVFWTGVGDWMPLELETGWRWSWSLDAWSFMVNYNPAERN